MFVEPTPKGGKVIGWKRGRQFHSFTARKGGSTVMVNPCMAGV